MIVGVILEKQEQGCAVPVNATIGYEECIGQKKADNGNLSMTNTTGGIRND